MSNQRIKYFITSKNIIKLLGLLMVISWNQVFAQGRNHNWLLGYHYNPTDTLSRMVFDSTSYNIIPEIRKMPFQGNTQANISDENGNLLMSSNGIFIADATNDTMMNGDSLNPNSFTAAYPNGLPLSNGNVFLPMPDDTNRYILIHQTGNYNANLSSTELYYSMVDRSLNAGLGEVVSKNQIILQDNLGWGINACRHANGRDWWVVALTDSMNYLYSILITPLGIDTVIKQSLLNMQPYSLFAGQPTFSLDGKYFAFASGYEITSNYWYHDIRIFNFNRCTGLVYNPNIINLTDSVAGFGVAFSNNSNFLYTSSFEKIFQINLNNFSVDTIAYYDGFNSPLSWCCPTIFYLMYLAANGKIYLTSGNGVQHIHEMNYPDSAGIACGLVQHAIQLNCFIKGAVPVHPNYYLGCDTTSGCPCLIPTTGINELSQHDFKFKISPNPNNGSFKIMYLLPQNKSGTLQIFDITGKEIYHQTLPPWSTLQYISLPKIADGVYQCTITSNNQRVNKKLVVVDE